MKRKEWFDSLICSLDRCMWCWLLENIIVSLSSLGKNFLLGKSRNLPSSQKCSIYAQMMKLCFKKCKSFGLNALNFWAWIGRRHSRLFWISSRPSRHPAPPPFETWWKPHCQARSSGLAHFCIRVCSSTVRPQRSLKFCLFCYRSYFLALPILQYFKSWRKVHLRDLQTWHHPRRNENHTLGILNF